MKTAHGRCHATAVFHARVPDQRAVREDVDIALTVPSLKHAVERFAECDIAEHLARERRIFDRLASVIIFDGFAGDARERGGLGRTERFGV